MADYRDWCGSCNQEINFGGHDPDCDWLHAQKIAYKESAEFEQNLYNQYNAKTDEEILDEAEALYEEIGMLSNILRAKERKFDFLRRNIMMDRGGFKMTEALAARFGRKYL